MLNYCVGCHNPDDYSGRLDFQAVDAGNLHTERATWEKVLRKLQSGAMPPRGEPKPDERELKGFLTELERGLDQVAAQYPGAGRSPLARLNRNEYANAVRDLLGIKVDIRSLMPPDNESYGFDNIADVLSISPVLLEQYLNASAKIADLAVGNAQTPQIITTYRTRPDFSQSSHIEGLPLGTRGGLLVEHNIPVDGDYLISAVLARNTADVLKGLEQEHVVDFLIDGESRYRPQVGGEADTKALIENTTNARNMVGERLQLKVNLKAGLRRIGVSFVEHNSALDDRQLQPFMRSTLDPVDEVGLPHLDSILITGPLNVTGGGSALSRSKIFICTPASTREESSCAALILANLARQAYRRPLDDSDVQPLLNMYRNVRSTGSFEQAIAQSLRLILSSPNFIYRFEPERQDVQPGTTYALNDQQLASRLSFFLWSSIPDAALARAAERGELQDQEKLGQQAKRMLADPKAFALTENFAGQWLLLRNLRNISPAPSQFPDFDDNLRQAFLMETQLFFNNIMQEDRSILELIDADYTFVNERLARHYGIAGVQGSQFRKVAAPPERRGLLGQGSILTVNSYATRTSPVLRGKWILSNLMGTPPPPPPPDVPALKATNADGKLLSVRAQMAQHRVNPSCGSCHNVMDPLGLALENFDAIGRWRTHDEIGTTVDASGELIDGTKINGPASLRAALLAQPEQFVITFTEKLMTYALGRGLTFEDAASVRQIVRSAKVKNYRFSALMNGIINSPQFRMKTRSTELTQDAVGPTPLATRQ